MAGPVYGLIALRGVRPIFDCLIRYPAIATSFRRLPYPFSWVLDRLLTGACPSFTLLVFLVPPAALLAAFGVLLFPAVRGRILAVDQTRQAMVYALAMLLGLGLYGAGRTDFQHLFPAYAASLCLLACLVQGCAGLVSGRVELASVVIGAGLVLMNFELVCRDYFVSGPVFLDRAAGIVTPVGGTAKLAGIVADVRHNEDGRPIFVAAQRHDRVFANLMIVYFLTGRLPGVYFAQYDPGLTTTEAVQRKIIDDLKRNEVRLIVVSHDALPDEPNLGSRSSGVRILDRFLAENFATIKTGNGYHLLGLRAARPPAPPRSTVEIEDKDGGYP